MTIGGVPPLINKPWFINPGLTLDGFVDVCRLGWPKNWSFIIMFSFYGWTWELGGSFSDKPGDVPKLTVEIYQLAVDSFTSEQKLTTKPIQSSLEFGSSAGAGCIASPKSGTGCGNGPAGSYLASAANCACGAGLATETSQAVNDVDGWWWLASRASSNQTARFWGHIDIHRPCGDLKGLSRTKWRSQLHLTKWLCAEVPAKTTLSPALMHFTRSMMVQGWICLHAEVLPEMVY